ncbi:MAG: hypothetical protein AAF721_42530 [Myxococcota bacterium]
MQRGIGIVALALALAACKDEPPPADGAGSTSSAVTSGDASTGVDPDTGAAPDSDGGSDGTSTGGPPPLPDVWAPGVLLPTDDQPHPRGLLDRRGLVHTHSPYSHDACDEMPRDEEGNLDQVCISDWRRALCQIQHDFVMLTDHRDSFSDSAYPDVLLFDPERGDALLERDGMPVANWAGCEQEAPGVPPTLVLAGCESATMPVGLPQHAAGRGGTYGDTTPEAIAELKDTGAVVLVAHTEGWSVEELVEMDIDGFEMFNLHANLFANLAAGLGIIDLLQENPEGLPHSDLVVMPIFSEDPAYLTRWGSVLAQGVRRVTTAGTDAHRNTFPNLLPDGERIDSYRRMMHWFSNHLLVTDDGRGGYDDRSLTAALGEGRLYAAFEYLGYPRGFDTYAELDGTITEIGGEVAFADGLSIVGTTPTVRRLDPDATAPEITIHLLRAVVDGFEEVASGEDGLSWTVDAPGAYRMEVRITPRHLSEYLGSYSDMADEPRIWIYANPIYVLP